MKNLLIATVLILSLTGCAKHLIVKSNDEIILIAGDQTMTKEEYCERKFSRWYPEANLKQLNESLDKAQSYKPDLVIPGHDRSFKPTK